MFSINITLGVVGSVSDPCCLVMTEKVKETEREIDRHPGDKQRQYKDSSYHKQVFLPRDGV